ncbi:Leucine-rich repeat-containing protein 57 [Astathelohania contejeani]|uniref:Leucine-rich repeat-containing protein 57 n=1 Tax=Astathelohania contejeani TaxID=164912 RepID=A0ABQ7I0W5_9MICR|nr:Leucine-rich repeat-containing protein 57 [Thelohania contejeani]
MGNINSKSNKKVSIVKINPTAPELLRLFNQPDQLYPYTLREETKEATDEKVLRTHIMQLDEYFQHHLLLSPRCEGIRMTGFEYMKEENEILEDILKHGDNVRTLLGEISIDNDQIYLCRKFVVELLPNIRNLQGIKAIQICCNYLSTIPPEIGFLKKLKVLILARNRIKYLPDEIGLLWNLKELNLSTNQLSSLPKSIASLKSLEILHIDNNKFEEIQTDIGEIKSLKYLNISNNNITYIPIEIFQLPLLSNLEASNCHFMSELDINYNLKLGVTSLKEECCKKIIRNNLPVYKTMNRSLVQYILSVKKCSFCTGPFFEERHIVTSSSTFIFDVYPVKYNLCRLHFKNEAERISSLFNRPSENLPAELYKSDIFSVNQLFNYYRLDREKRKDLKRLIGQSNDKIPLEALIEYNNPGNLSDSESGCC